MEKPERFRISLHPVGGPGINISLKKRFEEHEVETTVRRILSSPQQKEPQCIMLQNTASHRESRIQPYPKKSSSH